MYVKALTPGDPAVASLTATTSSRLVHAQLMARGWTAYGDDIGIPSTSTLEITHRSLKLVVDGQTLLSDLDPAAPRGWWSAVDQSGGNCVVIVLRGDLVDLHDPLLGQKMRELMDDPQAGVWALVPINHPAAGDE